MTPTDWPVAAPTCSGSTQPSAQAVSVIYFSTLPIVTAPWPENSIKQLPSHRRSCGQMRPQISGIVEVAFERRPEESRVVNECVSTCSTRRATYHIKQKYSTTTYNCYTQQ